MRLANYQKLEILRNSTLLLFIFLAPVCILTCDVKAQAFNILVLISAAFGFPFFIKDLKNRQFLAFWAFYYSVLFFLYGLNYGLDMTDEPYQLVLSYFLPQNDIFTVTNPLSYKLIHYIIKIFPTPWYLLARSLAALEFGLIIYFSVKSALLFRKQNTVNVTTYIFALLAAISLTFNYLRFNIPYDQVPMLIFVILIYLGLLAIAKSSPFNSLLFGLFFTLSLYTRITSFIFSSIFLAIITYAGIRKKAINKRTIFYFSIGLVAGIILLISLRVNLNLPILRFVHFDYNYCMPSSYEHSFTDILQHYLLDFQKLALYFVFIFPVIFVTDSILNKWQQSSLTLALFLVMLIFLFAEFNFNGWSKDSFFSWYFFSLAIFLALYLLIIIKRKKIQWLDLVILGLTMGFSFAGSNVGLRKIAFNGALGFSIIYVLLAYDLTKLSKYALYGWLLLLFGLGLSYRYNRAYRDYPKCKLNTTFTKIPVLKGIITTKDKVHEIEYFYKKLKSLDLNNNYITCNKTNIFELLIGKKALATCWLFNPDKIYDNASHLTPPKYVIFSNHSLRYYFWDKKRILAVKRDLHIIRKTKHMLDSLYKPIIYSNHKIFTVYKLKKLR